jgi:hypothetical protein
MLPIGNRGESATCEKLGFSWVLREIDPRHPACLWSASPAKKPRGGNAALPSNPATAMFRLSKLFLTLFAVVAVGQSASADDWMFHGSAYSYSPRWGREVGADRFSRGPYYTSQFGGVVRSGYRNLNSNLGGGWGRGGGGGTWDHNSVFESWYQMSGQYSY